MREVRYPSLEPLFPFEDLTRRLEIEEGQTIGFHVARLSSAPGLPTKVRIDPALTPEHWHLLVAFDEPRRSFISTEPVSARRVVADLRRAGVMGGMFGARKSKPKEFNPNRDQGECRSGRKPARTYRSTDLRPVYFIQAETGGPIKIGVTDDIALRLATFQTGNPAPLRVIGVIPGAGEKGENELHRRFAVARIRGEWFEPTEALLAHIGEVAVPYRHANEVA